MYTLKSIVRRGSTLGAAIALTVSAVLPAVFPVGSAFADALNPLTDRSLTLSSSAPGWDYLDGSGNTTYAPPNSGANGQKVGNTYEFKVSTDTTGGSGPLKAMTFQYCTTPAGNCLSPGDNGWTDGGGGVYTRNADSATTSDLNVTVSSPTEATLGTYVDTTASDGRTTSIPAATASGNNFMVYYRTSDNGTPTNPNDDDWAASTGWAMSATNHETGSIVAGTATGKNNEIRLVNTGTPGFGAGAMVRVVFFATNSNYITNPGSGAFFVRINTYKTYTAGTPPTVADSDIIDGGVTVANVMNQGIQITTKVLETMDFSVGVVDPYTLEATGSAGSQLANANGHTTHSICEPVLTKMTSAGTETANRLQMGDENGEFSLATNRTYATHSYFRLSSNSSAGATVYYSGNTLTNTVGDRINAIGDPNDTGTSDGAAHTPVPGSEQFGLALDIDGTAPYGVDYNVERKPLEVGPPTYGIYENGADNSANSIATGTYGSTGIDSSVTDDAISDVDANASWHAPQLAPLVPKSAYAGGKGFVNSQYGSVDTSFAFQPTSMLIPVAIASEDQDVVDCVTGKLRYIANIAATTPAGIYTTKINYIAAPQY